MAGATPVSAPHRPTLVLLHASASSARQWDTLADSLRPQFNVHAVDLHGHGGEAGWPRARPLGLFDEAALVQPLIEAAGAVHLVGHSYGGAVALHLAAAQPSRVLSLAVYEPVLFGLLAEQEPQSAAAREAFALAASLRRWVAEGRMEAAAQSFVDYWSGAGCWAAMTGPRQRAVATRMGLVLQHFDALYRELLPPQRLAGLRMPLLCLAGAGSTPAALGISALLSRLLPAARHELLAEMGHMGPLTHAPQVNQRLRAFLQAQLTPRHAAAAAFG